MNHKDLKNTLLLGLFLFLVSAPQPDSRTVAEITHNFIVPAQPANLLAADTVAPAQAPGEQATDKGTAEQDIAH